MHFSKSTVLTLLPLVASVLATFPTAHPGSVASLRPRKVDAEANREAYVDASIYARYTHPKISPYAHYTHPAVSPYARHEGGLFVRDTNALLLQALKVAIAKRSGTPSHEEGWKTTPGKKHRVYEDCQISWKNPKYQNKDEEDFAKKVLNKKGYTKGVMM